MRRATALVMVVLTALLLAGAAIAWYADTTLVHNPVLSPSAVWTNGRVFTISPPILYCCSRSSHALSGSNGMPSVVASIVAARSSTRSSVFFSLIP